MKYNFGLLKFLLTYKFVQCALEPFITGGSFVEYDEYPHATLLVIACGPVVICGGSVLNENVVLTAAHCLKLCEDPDVPVFIQVRYGHKDVELMSYTMMKEFVSHERYRKKTMENDIGLVLTDKTIPLNDVTKRVIMMRSPPEAEYGYVAGWGMDENDIEQKLLKGTNAKIQERELCKRLGKLPDSIFCAGPLNNLGAANEGDSGGALVINDYIQIGIVSYKIVDYSLVFYTNVSHFLDWIGENAVKMICS